MKIACPKCNSIYNIPENKIPQHPIQVKCKKSGMKLGIERIRRCNERDSMVNIKDPIS